MSSSSKVHVYPYSMRVAALSITTFFVCQNRLVFFLQPVEGALTIENLYIHLKMTFNTTIATGNRVVKAIAIGDSMPIDTTSFPSYYRALTLNVAADPTTRKVDIRLDLTTLLKKTNVGSMNGDGTLTGTGTWVLLELADALIGSGSIATLDLWKMDGLYTTKGTR